MKKSEVLQDCWIWDKSVNEFVADRVKGYSLNVCAGKSPIGDVKIDLDPVDKSILKGDMRCLPFDDNTFDTVIQDPPWKIGYYNRMFWVEFRIPFWRGISFNYTYGDMRWHTGKHSLVIMTTYYKPIIDWCLGNWKFYHTGLYIGHHKNCKANG